MTQQEPKSDDPAIGGVDTNGQPIPEQAPMDDAAGGPQADQNETIEDISTDDLQVQGGE